MWISTWVGESFFFIIEDMIFFSGLGSEPTVEQKKKEEKKESKKAENWKLF